MQQGMQEKNGSVRERPITDMIPAQRVCIRYASCLCRTDQGASRAAPGTESVSHSQQPDTGCTTLYSKEEQVSRCQPRAGHTSVRNALETLQLVVWPAHTCYVSLQHLDALCAAKAYPGGRRGLRILMLGSGATPIYEAMTPGCCWPLHVQASLLSGAQAACTVCRLKMCIELHCRACPCILLEEGFCHRPLSGSKLQRSRRKERDSLSLADGTAQPLQRSRRSLGPHLAAQQQQVPRVGLLLSAQLWAPAPSQSSRQSTACQVGLSASALWVSSWPLSGDRGVKHRLCAS